MLGGCSELELFHGVLEDKPGQNLLKTYYLVDSCLLKQISSGGGTFSSSCLNDSPFVLQSRVDNVGETGI